MRNLLIFLGALLSILGMSLFQEILWIRFSFLVGGVFLVLVGLFKAKEEQVSSKGKPSDNHDFKE